MLTLLSALGSLLSFRVPYGQKTDPANAPSRRLTMIVAQECRFRRKPATYSDLIAATLPI